jgi:hypothetical protein
VYRRGGGITQALFGLVDAGPAEEGWGVMFFYGNV